MHNEVKENMQLSFEYFTYSNHFQNSNALRRVPVTHALETLVIR